MTGFAPAIGVNEIRGYLASKHWQPSISGAVGEIWENAGVPDSPVLIPRIGVAPDFASRTDLLVRDLAEIENREASAVSYDISTVFFDITDLEASQQGEAGDTILVEAGQCLFETTQKLMAAAAGATIRRQGYFSRSMPTHARTHAKNLRLGHTRKGSYILPVLSPAQPAPEIPDQDEPRLFEVGVEAPLFDRRVMATLSGALEALEGIAVLAPREPTNSEVLDSVESGVSFEFCQAIKGIIGSPGISQLGISMRWSPAVVPPQGAISRAIFPEESTPVIERIASRLQGMPQKREDIIYGVVRRLEQAGASEPPAGGRAGIETFIEGHRRTVWVDLDEPSHDAAIRYYRERRRVTVRGVITEHRGRGWAMEASYFGADPAFLF